MIEFFVSEADEETQDGTTSPLALLRLCVAKEEELGHAIIPALSVTGGAPRFPVQKMSNGNPQ